MTTFAEKLGDIKLKEAQGALTDLSSGYALSWALGEMARGHQAAARKYIRRMWRIFIHNDEPSDELGLRTRESMKVVLDEFFNKDGNMMAAADDLLHDVKKMCPEEMWSVYYETLVITREQALKRCLAQLEKEKAA